MLKTGYVVMVEGLPVHVDHGSGGYPSKTEGWNFTVFKTHEEAEHYCQTISSMYAAGMCAVYDLITVILPARPPRSQ